jgi:hypothetical protein
VESTARVAERKEIREAGHNATTQDIEIEATSIVDRLSEVEGHSRECHGTTRT